MKTNVTIIGFGIMGKAIAGALKKDAAIKIFTVDKNKKDISGIQKSDFIILSVKPQDAEKALSELKQIGLSEKTIIISIMAGYPIKKITTNLKHKKIIRMMPNLGLSVGAGIAVWLQSGLSKEEVQKAKKFINKISENFEVKKEDTINKVTALSGSGPAYFFTLANCLVETGKKLGFNKEESEKLVKKTFLSSALLSNNSDYPSLIKKITSKKGTTEAALKVFKNKNFNKIVSNAIFAAYKRSKELSK